MILYIVGMHGLTKYRIGSTDDELTSQNDYGWIVYLRQDPPFDKGKQYEICTFNVTSERIYKRTSSSWLDSSLTYFNKNGEVVSSWYTDDTGQTMKNRKYVGNILDEYPPVDAIGTNLHACKRTPAWFFHAKMNST